MSTDKFYKVMEKLYGIGSDPISAMNKVLMENYMDFSNARECVHEIYEKRGYHPACDFINMLSGYELINLDDRTKLSEFILVFENNRIEKNKQKKLAQKVRKNLK
jgi:hypothetical protein